MEPDRQILSQTLHHHGPEKTRRLPRSRAGEAARLAPGEQAAKPAGALERRRLVGGRSGQHQRLGLRLAGRFDPHQRSQGGAKACRVVFEKPGENLLAERIRGTYFLFFYFFLDQMINYEVSNGSFRLPNNEEIEVPTISTARSLRMGTFFSSFFFS